MEGRTDERTDGTNENYIPLQHTLYAGGIKIKMSSAAFMISTLSIEMRLLSEVKHYLRFSDIKDIAFQLALHVG